MPIDEHDAANWGIARYRQELNRVREALQLSQADVARLVAEMRTLKLRSTGGNDGAAVGKRLFQGRPPARAAKPREFAPVTVQGPDREDSSLLDQAMSERDIADTVAAIRAVPSAEIKADGDVKGPASVRQAPMGAKTATAGGRPAVGSGPAAATASVVSSKGDHGDAGAEGSTHEVGTILTDVDTGEQWRVLDRNGRRYYANVATRQTSWHPPKTA